MQSKLVDLDCGFALADESIRDSDGIMAIVEIKEVAIELDELAPCGVTLHATRISRGPAAAADARRRS